MIVAGPAVEISPTERLQSSVGYLERPGRLIDDCGVDQRGSASDRVGFGVANGGRRVSARFDPLSGVNHR
jgi:hypothetical protein